MMRKLLLIALVLLASGRVDATCCCYSASVDALFFKPHECGLSFGYLHEGDDAFTDATNFCTDGKFRYKTKVQTPDFKWNTGSRLKFAVYPCGSCLELSANWTHFHGHAHGKAKGSLRHGVGSVFVGTWSAYSAPLIDFNANSFASFGKANLSFVIDMVDMQAGYCIFPANCFSLKPLLGVRFGWIPQTYRLDNSYDGAVFIHEEITLKNAFFGAGLLFGCEANYTLGCGISLYALAQASLLKGNFDIRETYKQEADLRFLGLKQKEHLKLQRTVTDLALGLQGTNNYFCFPLTIRLAWEQHLYFGQNQLQALGLSLLTTTEGVGPFGVQESNRGDLDLQGVTLSFKFDF